MIKLRKYDDLSELEKLSLIKLSYSRLSSFDMCPALYFYRYIEKVPQKFGGAAVLGNIIHSTLEDEVGKPLVYEDLLERFEDHREQRDPDHQISEDLIASGIEMLGEFVDRHEGDTFNIIGKELPFQIVIGSALIRGFMDLVCIRPDGIIACVDYKAQPLDTLILTPNGWVKMGDISVDDYVIGKDGKKTRVTAIYPQGFIPAYRISFDDGTSTICSEEHLWEIKRISKKSPQVSSLKEIMNKPLRHGVTHVNSIPTVDPIEFAEPACPLPIPAYIMGVILGDGGTSGQTIKIHSQDQEIIDRVKELLPSKYKLILDHVDKRGFKSYKISSVDRKNEFKNYLRSIGLMGKGSKSRFFIPEEYLRASVEDRLDLLRGLMDTDGGTSTRTAFVTTSPLMKEGIIELVRSLGGLPMWSKHPSYYKDKLGNKVYCKDKYVINLRIKQNPFYLKYKAEGFKQRKLNDDRRITSIERIPDLEMQCISVENKDGLYVTNDYIVTHNSGKKEVSYKDAKNDLQLGVYALALSQLFDTTTVHAELYYLRSGNRKSHVFTEEDLEAVYYKTLDKVKQIIKRNNFLPDAAYAPGWSPCSFCDMADFNHCKPGAMKKKKLDSKV